MIQLWCGGLICGIKQQINSWGSALNSKVVPENSARSCMGKTSYKLASHIHPEEYFETIYRLFILAYKVRKR